MLAHKTEEVQTPRAENQTDDSIPFEGVERTKEIPAEWFDGTTARVETMAEISQGDIEQIPARVAARCTRRFATIHAYSEVVDLDADPRGGPRYDGAGRLEALICVLARMKQWPTTYDLYLQSGLKTARSWGVGYTKTVFENSVNRAATAMKDEADRPGPASITAASAVEKLDPSGKKYYGIGCKFVAVGDNLFRYEEGRYVSYSDAEIAAFVRRGLQRIYTENPSPKSDGPHDVTVTEVNNVVAAIKANRALPQYRAADGPVPFDTYIVGLTDDDANRYYDRVQSGKSIFEPRRWLATQDGIIDLDDGGVGAHTPGWFSMAKIPWAAPRGEVVHPKWTAFLEDVFEGDAERIALAQEVFGACLDRNLIWQYYVLLVGSGANGKGVFLRVLEWLLGAGNYSSVSLADLAGGNRFALFDLLGKLANIRGDDGAVEAKDEAVLKSLTGGDPIPFERKFHQPVFATNRAKIIIGCNRAPRIVDVTNGVARRRLPIPFNKTYRGGAERTELSTLDYWREEMSAILSWAYDGLARLKANGGRPTKSKAVEELLAEQIEESNPVRAFLTDHYTTNPVKAGARAPEPVAPGDVYEAYLAWYERTGGKPGFAQARPTITDTVKAVFGVKCGPVTSRRGPDGLQQSVRYLTGLRRLGVEERELPPDASK